MKTRTTLKTKDTPSQKRAQAAPTGDAAAIGTIASAPPAQPPLLLNHADAAALLSMARSTFKNMVRNGHVGPMPLKFSTKLVKWRRAELEAWVAAGCPNRRQWAGRLTGGAA